MAPRNVPREVATARSRVASLTRSRTPDDPELIEAKRALRAANILARVERIADEVKELTPEQADRIAALLKRDVL